MRQFEKYALVFMRTYLGGFNLISGLNFFLHFWPQPVPGDPLGKAYMDATRVEVVIATPPRTGRRW